MKKFLKYLTVILVLAGLLVAFQTYRIDFENQHIDRSIYSNM